MLKGLTCVTFDLGWDFFEASHGVWLSHENVTIVPNCGISGNCGRFDSSDGSNLQLPYFSNAFDQFSEFSMSFWFKRNAGGAGLQSLINNYACDVASSVDVSSSGPDVVSADIRNGTGAVVTLADIPVSDGGKQGDFVVVANA